MKIKLEEGIDGKVRVLKEQDLSKIEWHYRGKHEMWFKYPNTFSKCRSAFTSLLKDITKYFGDEITNEVNQFILSFKRGVGNDFDKTGGDSRRDRESVIKYLKPEFERIGIKWTDEDEKAFTQSPNNSDLKKKKNIVDTALYDIIFENYHKAVYTVCKNEYKDARRKYQNRDTRDYKRDLEQSEIDYTKISGDNKQLQGKLKAANAVIAEKDILIAKLKKKIAQGGGGGESPIIKTKREIRK